MSVTNLDFQGVSLEDLVLVRVFHGIDTLEQNGDYLVAKKFDKDTLEHSNTIHFALNGVVSNHVYGAFDGAIAVVVPLKDVLGMGHKPSGFRAEDTWFHYDSDKEFKIPKSAVLICPEGTDVGPDLNVASVVKYKKTDGNEARNDAIEKVVQNLGAPVKKIGMWNWQGQSSQGLNDDEKKQLSTALGVNKINVNSHANSAESSVELYCRKLGVCNNEVEKGNFYSEENGADLPISFLAQKMLDNLQKEIEQHKTAIDCTNSNNFFTNIQMKAALLVDNIKSLADRARAESEMPRQNELNSPPPLPKMNSAPPPLPSMEKIIEPLTLKEKIEKIREQSFDTNQDYKPSTPKPSN